MRHRLRQHRLVFIGLLLPAAMVGLVTVAWAIWGSLGEAYGGCFHRWDSDPLCIPNAIFNVGLPAALLTMAVLAYPAKKRVWPYDEERE